MMTLLEYLLSRHKPANKGINDGSYVIVVLLLLHKIDMEKMIAEYKEYCIGDGGQFPIVLLKEDDLEKFCEKYKMTKNDGDYVVAEVPSQYSTLEALREAYFDHRLKLNEYIKNKSIGL